MKNCVLLKTSRSYVNASRGSQSCRGSRLGCGSSRLAARFAARGSGYSDAARGSRLEAAARGSGLRLAAQVMRCVRGSRLVVRGSRLDARSRLVLAARGSYASCCVVLRASVRCSVRASFCVVLRHACVVLPRFASCVRRFASFCVVRCVVRHASCVVRHASCVVLRAPCSALRALRRSVMRPCVVRCVVLRAPCSVLRAA